jgi:ABC-type transport system involved in multi-copper enzyme maturation permease subunit
VIRLLKIEWLKNRNYKAFWILTGLYFLALAISASVGIEFLKWMDKLGAEFGFDVLKIPLYHFPDIWQNVTYFALFFKYVLGIVVIISITNEFSYKTIRQNIIDGLDRWDFLKSKLYTILILSAFASVLIFVIALITGIIYTPNDDMRFMFKHVEFIFGFFLETISFMLFALLIGTLVKRSGLAIGLLFLYTLMIEPLITFNLGDKADWLGPYFPVRAIHNIIKVPYQRYFFLEIRDYITIDSVVVLLIYAGLFVYLTFLLLKKRDLQ